MPIKDPAITGTESLSLSPVPVLFFSQPSPIYGVSEADDKASGDHRNQAPKVSGRRRYFTKRKVWIQPQVCPGTVHVII